MTKMEQRFLERFPEALSCSENNKAVVCGVLGKVEFSHKVKGKKFFKAMLSVKRLIQEVSISEIEVM